MSPLEIQIDTMVNDPLRPNLSSRLTQQDLVNKGLNLAGFAPVGMVGKVPLQNLSKQIKPNKLLRNEANAHTGQVQVGPKFWKLPPDAKKWVLEHENTHLSGIENVVISRPDFWEGINKRGMFGPVSKDTGAIMQGVNGQTIPTENMVEALTAYRLDPEWLQKTYPEAYTYIQGLLPRN
jgi:hypothetical protein